MIVKLLSLSYLSKYVGMDSFALIKKSYKAISEDGYFENELSDKELAVQLFENSIPEDFFEKQKVLVEFCFALPPLTQDKIKNDLDLDDLSIIKWNLKTSEYFIEELGLSTKFKTRKEKKSKSNVAIMQFSEPEIKFKKLKEYQTGVFFDTYNYISSTPYARCIIQMPTGSGKTRTSMEIVAELINDTGRDVLWLANTEELCDQAFHSFNEVWMFLGKKAAQSVNHMRSGGSKIDNDLPTFHVASLQSFNSGDKSARLETMGIGLTNLELLIVDEAHISVAPTYRDTIKSIISQGTKLIGLTATPGRHLKSSSGDDGNALLSDFYFNKMFELKTGDELPIDYLRNKGILSNARFVSIEGANIEKIISESELKKCNENKVFPKKIEQLLTNDANRTAIIFDQLITLLRGNKKIIFFGTSIAHSKLICALLKMKGFAAAHVDGGSGKYRSQIINDFKEGNTQILCNYGVLSTGFDDPQIDVVFMARPTSSIVLYSQIIGRGLRGPLIGGTDSCEVYTVFDNILDLPDNNEIYSYFDEYFIN